MAKAATSKTTRNTKASADSGAASCASALDSVSAEAAGAAAPTGKLGALTALLRRPEGPSVAAMAEATGWQAHSVRGALSGGLKRKHGLAVTSEKTAAGRVYRITGASA